MKLLKAPKAVLVKHLRVFPDGVLLLCVLASIGVFLRGLFIVQSNAQWGGGILLGSALLTIALTAIFFLKLSIRINITLLLIALFVSMMGLEFFLASYDLTPASVPQHIAGQHSEEVERVASETGVELDPRTQYDVIDELQAEGHEAYPEGLHAPVGKDRRLFITNEVLPFSNHSFADIVFCNEAGPWVTFKSDRYGFNNDDDVYDKDGLRGVILGDSFAQGVCAERDENVSGWLGQHGYSMLNLGLTGSGSLRQLAIFREYATPIAPQVVLWMYFGNDLDDLMVEFEEYNPVLKRYLNPQFSQNLRERQREVDALLEERWAMVMGHDLEATLDLELDVVPDSGLITDDVTEVGTGQPDLVDVPDGGTGQPDLVDVAEVGTEPPDLVDVTEVGTGPPDLVDVAEVGTEQPDLVEATEVGTGQPDLVDVTEVGTEQPDLVDVTEVGTEQPDRNGNWQKVLRFAKAKATLYEIRSLIGVTQSGISPEIAALNTEKFQRFRSVLEHAIDETSKFDGELYFVYLPGYQDFTDTPGENRDAVLSIVDELEIPLIDFYPVLNGHEDPLSFFPFRLNGHYTPAGYEWLATTIIEKAFGGQIN